jgi:hypothetical protein
MSLFRHALNAHMLRILLLALLSTAPVLPAPSTSPLRATSAQAQIPAEPALVSASGGMTGSLAVQGSTGILALGASLAILNLQAPANPTLRTSLPWVSTINDLTVANNLVYVVDAARELRIVDVSAPDQPVLRGSLTLPGYGQVVAVDNNIAAVSITQLTGNFITGYALRLIDISDPDHPALRGSTPLWFETKTIQIVGTLAFVAAHGGESDAYPGGIQIIDISHPDQPLLRG